MTQAWDHAHGSSNLDHCLVMAIVNVTPDSFHDGGRWLHAAHADTEAIVEQCRRWVEAGAGFLDVGGESTRPGATPVSHAQELARVVPVVEALAAALPRTPISIDTRHAAVAEGALAAGAAIVNDVSGLADPAMAGLVAEAKAGLVIGHMRGEPSTMQSTIHFDALLPEVGDELAGAVAKAVAAGVEPNRILVDPCIGFGKTPTQSAALVAASELLHGRTGRPVLIGASRKRFLSALTGGKAVEQRRLASVIAAVSAAAHGAAVVRVHDVFETLEALAVFEGIEHALARASTEA